MASFPLCASSPGFRCSRWKLDQKQRVELISLIFPGVENMEMYPPPLLWMIHIQKLGPLSRLWDGLLLLANPHWIYGCFFSVFNYWWLDDYALQTPTAQMIHLAVNQLQDSSFVKDRGAFSPVFPFLDLQIEEVGWGRGVGLDYVGFFLGWIKSCAFFFKR